MFQYVVINVLSPAVESLLSVSALAQRKAQGKAIIFKLNR